VPDRIPAASLPAGSVGRAGRWAVVNRDGQVAAVSARCRHQLGDLSRGSLDASGCLVCPWHGSRYDVDSGEMVSGPKGFLWYVGRTPGYTQLIKAYGKVLVLRRRPVRRSGEHYVVEADQGADLRPRD
jgi:nitrite reductase/ring-hydroxylating ferredoxin subunit